MPPDPSLRDRFWRDVVVAAGPNHVDPCAIREAVEDMMRNYSLDEVPGFEATPKAEPSFVPDTTKFSSHSAFTPVFSRNPAHTPSSWNCFSTARPIFVGPRRSQRRRKSCPEPRHPDHFPSGSNPGIQANKDHAPMPTHPVPQINNASPWYQQPPLPPWAPHHYVWAYPTGHLAWSPHPQPTPSIPQPLSPWAAISLTGGHPLPGTMPQWTPGTWPPLDWARDVPIRLAPYIIPNPNNAHLPLIDWNVTKHPSTAKRLTPNHVVVAMENILGDHVTHTDAHTIVVTCDVGHMSTLWGPIVVDQSTPVTLRNLFDAIYQYFQVPLTYPEVQYIFKLNPSNYWRMTDAYRIRCRESAALPGWEAKQGYRRADVLGDRRHWWGVWISSRHGRWWLNLGLVNPSHRGPLH
ncbi:hypothetical protein JVU11DRAFT_12223 [Chiua virens]|nr:hypothetical protein JVU11DRAFT_12223 [Chiua virens]